MSGHRKWASRPGAVPAETRAYVNGYLLALEDITSDLEGLVKEAWDNPANGSYLEALGDVAMKIAETRVSTWSTLETIDRLDQDR